MDSWTSKKRSAVMALVKSKGNKSTELAFMKLLRLNKITGWRRHLALPGKPDFAFPSQKLAVFVDGDFWHGHSGRRIPQTNREFWLKKIRATKARDRKINQLLRNKDWVVIRIWESSLRKFPERQIRRIKGSLRSRSLR